MQCRRVVNPGLIFEANFRSEQDGAWKLYTVRALGLKVSSGTPAAKNVMELGLAYFGKAEDAWPNVIRFYGETQGWDEAKRRAVECGKFFRYAAARCNGAAISPSEQAEADRRRRPRRKTWSTRSSRKSSGRCKR